MDALQQGLYNNQNIPAGQAGSPWTVSPPNPSTPVSGSTIVNGNPLNFPTTPPSDNGNAFVAGAVAGSIPPPLPEQSQTPGLDMGISGDYTKDTGYQAALTGLNQAQGSYAGAVNNAPTASSILDSTQGQFGLADKAKALSAANTDLAATSAKYNMTSQQAETSGITSGTPAVYYQGAQAAIQRQAAVDVGAKATIQAAAQGNYDRAYTLAKDTAEFKYKDVQDGINRLKDFVTMNKDNVTAAESKAVAKIDAQQKQQQIKLDQQKQVFTWSLTYPKAGITETDTMPQAAKKAAAWVAQNPYTGQKPTVIGSHYDEYGNKVETYGLVGVDGQIKPLDYNSTQGNINFGMSTGTILGLPTYNTQDNNPGVNRPIRNNNPGNIKATATSINYPGVVGIESTPAADGGNFLIFSDPQAGMKAVGNLLMTNIYKGMTAEKAIKKYNGGGGYGATDLGLDPNQDLQAQLQDPAVLDRVTTQLASLEGFNATTTGVQGAVGTTGSQTIDTTTPNYSSGTVGKTGMTQAAIDQNALQYALDGKMPTLGQSGKGQPALARKAIINRAAELNSGGNIAANRENLKALSSSLTEQTKYLNTIDRSLSNAEDGFKQITTAFGKAKINTSESAFLNAKANDIAKFFGNNQEALRAFQAGLYEVQNEYSQVFSRGGQRTLEGNKEAQDLLNGNLSIKDLIAVQKELQQQGDIVKNGSQAQVQKIQDQINNIISPTKTSSQVNSQAPTGSPPSGQIWVQDKASGQWGSIPTNEFDANKYIKQ